MRKSELENVLLLNLLNILFFSCFFMMSYLLLSWYDRGDQISYIKFYVGVENLSYFEAYFYARGVIGAYDPLSIFILWLGSWLGIPKVIYISLWNSVFLSVILKIVRDNKVRLIFYPLIFTNFYILVLLTGAERLKFGFLFLAISALLSNRVKWLSLGAALLSHFQIFLLVPSLFFSGMWNDLIRLFKRGRVSKRLLVILFFSSMVVVFFVLTFGDGLVSKFFAYYKGEVDFSFIVNILLLLVVSILVSKNWKRLAVSLLPFFVFAILLGDSRVNILAMLFVFWVFMKEGVLGHPLSIALMVYFSIKSIWFVYNIYNFGNGFA